MTYGNKSFLLNVIDYLCDDSGMMVIRNKDYRLRLIDPAVLESNTQPLKLINLLSPLLLILLFGVFKFYKRRRQYAQ
jgi:ABC-2 type transport system permease protein